MSDEKKMKLWEEIRRVALNEGKRDDEKDIHELMEFFGLGRDATRKRAKSLIETGMLTRRAGKHGAWYYSPVETT